VVPHQELVAADDVVAERGADGQVADGVELGAQALGEVDVGMGEAVVDDVGSDAGYALLDELFNLNGHFVLRW